MVAVIGGETHRFAPLVELYRKAGKAAGHPPEKLKVGLHSLGHIAETTEKAIDEFYPGYAANMTRLGKERGWPPVTRPRFDAQAGPLGALIVGGPKDVAEKIIRHSKALAAFRGLHSRWTVPGSRTNNSKTRSPSLARKSPPW